MTNIFCLKNEIMHYEWGTKDVLPELLGIENPDNEPQAEIWIGAHNKLPSSIDINGQFIPLNKWLDTQNQDVLGAWKAKRNELPFLMKVLSAAEPLSMQIHPAKEFAERGFARENSQGIGLDDYQRNYKDDNHKPEILIAITEFAALAGLLPWQEAEKNIKEIGGIIYDRFSSFFTDEENKLLVDFYIYLLGLSEDDKREIILDTLVHITPENNAIHQEIAALNRKYPNDIAFLSPALFNVLYLKPFEAVFISPGTLHSYIRGTGIEVMAASDNVIRGGLTSKYIDLTELKEVASPSSFKINKIAPSVAADGKNSYATPVDDFCVDIIDVSSAGTELKMDSLTIAFCLAGHVDIKSETDAVTLSLAQSCLISANSPTVKVSGTGKLVVVSSRL